MQAPDSIETILARLMPPALSGGAQSDIEAMLEDLAAEAPAPAPVVLLAESPRRNWVYPAAVAASVALLAAVLAGVFPKISSESSSAATDGTSVPGVVLVGATGRIESMTDEGWREDSDGSALQALGMNVVEENNLLDSETGIVMKVAETRGELLLMPVSAF